MNDATLQDAVDALQRANCKPTQHGNSYVAYCPVHEGDGHGHKPSLTLTRGDKVPVVMTCHAGCSHAAIMAALGIEPSARRSAGAGSRRIVATYRYTDASGTLLFEKVRYEPKDFCIRHRDASGAEVWRLPRGIEPPLYRLPAVKAATASGEPIYVCEGEKDADRLAAAGLCATTGYEGAAAGSQKPKWRDSYTAALTGADVVLLPDNDEPGQAHMRHVAAALAGKALVRWLELPGLLAKGDVSDWLNQGHTIDELKTLATAAPEPPDPIQPEASEHVIFRKASNVIPQPIDWLWPGWIAKGKLHILAGPPGTSKTNLAIAINAALTVGGYLPGGFSAKPCNVVIWSGEDSIEDTLVPRLIANGADLDRVHFIQAVSTRKGINRPFDPAIDIPLLKKSVMAVGEVGMLTVDSVASVVLGDGHKNNQVRRALQPLVDLTNECHCGALGITHLTKGSGDREPIDRLVGSVAFGGVARIVMMAVKLSEEHGGGRLLVRVKSNIGPDDGGYRYTVKQGELQNYPGIETSWVEFGDAVDGNPRDLLAMAETIADPEERGAVREAQDFIKEVLANGPALSKDLEKRAAEQGISHRTLARARKLLGIQSGRGIDGAWRCSLPSKKVGIVGIHGIVGIVGTVGTHEKNDGQECQNNGQECQVCQTVGTVDPDENHSLSFKSAKSANFSEKRVFDAASPDSWEVD